MAEYTREQLLGALEKADKAGDTEAAKAIASKLKETQDPKDDKFKEQFMSIGEQALGVLSLIHI